MKKIVGMGACVFDTLISCDTYPVEDTKQKAESVFISGGGPVGNALVVASKLGVETEVLGAFGGDNAAAYLLEDFNRYGVKTDNVVKLENASSFTSYIVLAQDKKTRTCVFDRGSVLDKEENVKLSAIDGATVLHLDGNYLNGAIAAAKYAKEKGVKVSLDAGGLYANIEKLLPYVDLLIPSAEFAMGFTKTSSIIEAMNSLKEQFNPEVLVVTNGSDGGYYFENGEVKHYGGIKVNAVDTNGAGDTFHGAFLVAYCSGKSLVECCNFASAVSAYKCTFKGARTYPLNLEIIEKFMMNNAK